MSVVKPTLRMETLELPGGGVGSSTEVHRAEVGDGRHPVTESWVMPGDARVSAPLPLQVHRNLQG